MNAETLADTAELGTCELGSAWPHSGHRAPAQGGRPPRPQLLHVERGNPVGNCREIGSRPTARKAEGPAGVGEPRKRRPADRKIRGMNNPPDRVMPEPK